MNEANPCMLGGMGEATREVHRSEAKGGLFTGDERLAELEGIGVREGACFAFPYSAMADEGSGESFAVKVLRDAVKRNSDHRR